ncbi:hypothetical protein [Pyrococcus kukulkanii]|uniref:Uncharacterized protein n=1 Tax=Pyrococcus kukulkanii TaxID=1609559 RepID=A0ABV4T662_9EURY
MSGGLSVSFSEYETAKRLHTYHSTLSQLIDAGILEKVYIVDGKDDITIKGVPSNRVKNSLPYKWAPLVLMIDKLSTTKTTALVIEAVRLIKILEKDGVKVLNGPPLRDVAGAVEFLKMTTDLLEAHNITEQIIKEIAKLKIKTPPTWVKSVELPNGKKITVKKSTIASGLYRVEVEETLKEKIVSRRTYIVIDRETAQKARVKKRVFTLSQ